MKDKSFLPKQIIFDKIYTVLNPYYTVMKLTNLTFETVKQELINMVKEKYPDQWNDFNQSNLGVVFIELIAGITDKLAFYINQLANEMFLATAKQRASVVKIAKMLGYTPKRAVPATGTVIFSLQGLHNVDINIPAGTRLKAGNIYVETVENSVIRAGQTQTTALAIQRDRIEVVYTAKGETFEKFFISNEKAYDFLVYVDGVLYQETDSFITQVENNTYKVLEDINGYWIEIYKLMPGSRVRIIAFTTEGQNGNISSNTLKLEDVIKDIQGNIIPVQVFNTVFTGGKDKESIDEIKRNAIIYLKSNNRAITKEDYEGLVITNVPEVAKVCAMSPSPGVVDVYICQFDGSNFVGATTEVKDKVARYLGDVKALTDKVVIKDMPFNHCNVSIKIKISSGYNANTVRTEIERRIKEYFYKLSPGQAVSISDLYDISNVEGVIQRTIVSPATDINIQESYLNVLGVAEVEII